jgi:NAD(P)-dependent dehydrogenase (short-subunit alcohol dehydrogenase family)
MSPAALDRFRLDGRVAIVTGASAGLGAVLARGLAEAGAGLMLTGRNEDRLNNVAARVAATGVHVETLVADVRSFEDCAGVVRTTADTFGHMDVLVNNAGITYAAAAHKDRPEAFTDLLATNLIGAYQMAQLVGAWLIEHGRPGSIVNISSVLGLAPTGLPTAAYSSSKAGLIGMTRSLAAQWSGRHSIRVNALAPGYIATEMTGELLASEDAVRKLIERTPMRRLATAEELIGPTLLLASDAGSYITGATLAVDGGWSMH